MPNARRSKSDMEVLLSFNKEDCHLAEALRATLFLLEPDLDVMEIILSPACYGAVQFEEIIANGVREADQFLLLVGPRGLSKPQEIECKFALTRRWQDSSFALIPVLAANAEPPSTAIMRDLSWIELPVVTDRRAGQWIIQALRNSALLGVPVLNAITTEKS